jgi:hypothetical protein
MNLFDNATPESFVLIEMARLRALIIRVARTWHMRATRCLRGAQRERGVNRDAQAQRERRVNARKPQNHSSRLASSQPQKKPNAERPACRRARRRPAQRGAKARQAARTAAGMFGARCSRWRGSACRSALPAPLARDRRCSAAERFRRVRGAPSRKRRVSPAATQQAHFAELTDLLSALF